jgi:hypothetical protein
MRFADQLGLDMKAFVDDLASHRWSERVAADVDERALSRLAKPVSQARAR